MRLIWEEKSIWAGNVLTPIFIFFSGTKFGCAGADQTKAECKTADGKETCYCENTAEGTECNKYTQANFYSSAVTISTPALLISALIVSGFASTS